MMFIRAYLRASTEEQDAGRALASLEQFVSDHRKVIASVYLENASGATANRPELLRLLKDARKGDVLLVESIDRLSRLPVEDWQKLKAAIDSKGLRIVALDLPTSHQGMQDTKGDEFTGRMLGAINSMLVEMMAAIARKDYEQRRDRQAQGIEKAKAAGKYQGRPVDADLHRRVTDQRPGHSLSRPQKAPPEHCPARHFVDLLLPPCFHGKSELATDRRERPYLYGVPGPVLTANLSLRRRKIFRCLQRSA
jgi:DNA invertase Pin-like site-specific DNA recombinase